jgi:hypothetical protein
MTLRVSGTTYRPRGRLHDSTQCRVENTRFLSTSAYFRSFRDSYDNTLLNLQISSLPPHPRPLAMLEQRCVPH